MTENEAVELFKELLDVPCEMLVKYDSVATEEQKKALVKIRIAEEMAIKALEEIRQYRAIGTVEEFKVLKENERKCEDCAGCTNWKCDCANVRAKAIDDFLHNAETKICDRILQNQARLDFASGLSVANRILDEIAEQMKAGGENGTL